MAENKAVIRDIKGVHTRIRGTRAPFKKPSYDDINAVEDCALNIFSAGL